ncbi:EAL domain-containing protein [Gallaecimonas mangrovi]|uniref:EAL domain-containing protein n=1 Tax=Gallaecimonas mangrovi TaxID=2291597 RepID=UPI000E2009C1|nr:EAL domain-containing protein [Gallaecimonas mangrovi]
MLRIASLLASVCYLLLLTALPCVKAFADDAPASDYYLYKTINKSNGLSQLSVFDIKKDQQGYYWLATAGGLYRFDGVSLKKFDLYRSNDDVSHYIRNISVDEAGTIWAGTQRGLISKTINESTFSIVNSFRNETIWSIHSLGKGYVLISTDSGLWLYNEKDKTKTLKSDKNQIKSIYTGEKSILLGSFRNGLIEETLDYHVVKSTEEFGKKINKIKKYNNYIYIASDEGLFKLTPELLLVKKLSSGSVNDFFLKDGNLIIAKNKGLFEKEKNHNESKVFDGKVWALLSINNYFFIATHAEGLKEYHKYPASLKNILLPNLGKQVYITYLAKLNNTLYIIDNENYLYKYNLKTRQIEKSKSHDFFSVFSNESSILISKQNEIQLLNESHSSETYHFKNYIIDADWSDNWKFIDEKRQLFEIESGRIEKLHLSSSCDFGFVNFIKFFSKKIFIGGENGLCRFDIHGNNPEKLSNELVKEYALIKNNLIFFSKRGSVINSNGKKISSLDLNDSEDLYALTSIHSEKDTYLFTSTSKGLRVYLKDGNKFKAIKFFDSRYPLLKEYVANSVTDDSKDNVYFGGIKGISKISLKKLNKSIDGGHLLVSNLKIYNKDNPSLLSVLNKKHHLQLERYQYPFTFSIALLNYPYPDKVKIQYNLSSYGQDWYHFDGFNSLTLSNLESGVHYLKFRALDNNVVVANSPVYKINILPPWWQSTTAFFIYSLFLLSVFMLIASNINNRRKQHAKILESEERLKLALWGSGDELWDWDIKSGNIYRSNIWNTLLLPNDGFRGKDERNNIYKNDLPRVKSALEACLEGNQEEFEVAYRVQDKNGHWLWILDRGRVVEYDDNGLPLRITGTLKNISHLKKTEEMLKLLARCFTNISDAICIVTPDFIIQEVNDSFVQITGIGKEQAIGKPWYFSLYNSSFLEQVKLTLDRYGRWHDEIEAQRQNGEIYPIDITIDKVFDEEKDDFNYVAVFSDISERKEKERELERLTNTDTLTSLPNRSLFMSTLASLVRKAQPFALLVLDLNNFKQINDSLGHQFGDRLLIEASARLNKSMQSYHTLYRLGGDEFAVLIENATKLDEVTRLAIDMHQQLSQPIHIEGEELNMSCAIGAVIYPDDGATPEYLLRNADAAMYHAKHEDNKSCQFFSSSMNEQANARLAIENRIRKALRENLFEVYYQPKVDTQTSRCNGAEALLRLPDGKGGYISPVEFIPVAEESGLIIEVGNWVMEASCQQVKKWYDQGMFPGRIAINLSARQFRHSDLISVIDDVLVRTGLPTHILELEITEGAMMEDPKRAIATMNRMRERGITLAMDDFGTGYSSLSNLRQFPVTCIKIDRIFVKDLTTDESARSLTEGIIHLARTLGLHVVAEGVETIEQLTELKALQCPTCQGFLFGKPMPADEFEQKLNNRGGLLGPADVVDLKR